MVSFFLAASSFLLSCLIRSVKRELTEEHILEAVHAGTLFELVECDIRVTEALRGHSAEMQPVFNNTGITPDDIGLFMRRYIGMPWQESMQTTSYPLRRIREGTRPTSTRRSGVGIGRALLHHPQTNARPF